ncbi:hypothetical protein [Bradyrhizobium sp. ARR65]|uniref:hypothetical protein n=1 Tax=Bradyrhizobium sp. ARR65 TaxID=1040989 RepID=UPI000462E944|nr:hypothetical protein [Bradyrhizobium sp. ARR65]
MPISSAAALSIDFVRTSRVCKDAYRRIVVEEKVVSPDELARAREHRERGWSIIRRRYIEGEYVAEADVQGFSQDEGLSRAYEEQALDRDLEDLRDRHIQVLNKRNADRQEFEAIGDHDTAARAAVYRQSALVEMGDAAAQYIRLRSAIVLLQWVMERFREKSRRRCSNVPASCSRS